MSRLKLVLVCGGALAFFLTIGAARAQPPALMSPYRTWRDASGAFEIVAALVKATGAEEDAVRDAPMGCAVAAEKQVDALTERVEQEATRIRGEAIGNGTLAI